jgi:N-acetyl-alpha-D-muramate 1-phosphate uridylyltransferase
MTSPRQPKTPAAPHSAMVLGAGLGTRMRPVTDDVPKPLVRLHGKPLVDHVLDRLAQSGIGHAVVNVHHMADKLERHLAGRQRPRITISSERDVLLDTGGGVKNALALLGPDPFLIHNSDSVWIEGVGDNLQRLIQTWEPQRMDCLLMLALGSSSLGYKGRGDFSFEPDGRIRRRREQEVVPFVFAGVSIAHPRLFNDTPNGAFSMNLAWNKAILAGRAFGVRMEGIWMHVGSPDALADAEQALAGTAPR